MHSAVREEQIHEVCERPWFAVNAGHLSARLLDHEDAMEIVHGLHVPHGEAELRRKLLVTASGEVRERNSARWVVAVASHGLPQTQNLVRGLGDLRWSFKEGEALVKAINIRDVELLPGTSDSLPRAPTANGEIEAIATDLFLPGDEDDRCGKLPVSRLG